MSVTSTNGGNDLGQEILVKFMVQSLKFKNSWVARKTNR